MQPAPSDCCRMSDMTKPPPIPKGAMPKQPNGLSQIVTGVLIAFAIMFVVSFIGCGAILANSGIDETLQDMGDGMNAAVDGSRAVRESAEEARRLSIPSERAVQ
jgi:hypothetical protein